MILHEMDIDEILRIFVRLNTDDEISIITEYFNATIPALMFIDEFKCMSGITYYKGLTNLYKLTGYNVSIIHLTSIIKSNKFIPRSSIQNLMLYIFINDNYSHDEKISLIQNMLNQKNYASSKLQQDIVAFLIKRTPDHYHENIHNILNKVFNRKKLLNY